ncbi:MAG: peptidoglycan-binding protein [Deltaproteobacteria bacterium]|nr:peptidoglycan-binding protein [Deltaproteobacteria bacterium]
MDDRFRRPAGDIRTADEERWCLRQYVRADIFARFLPGSHESAPFREALEHLGLGCGGAQLLSNLDIGELLGPGRQLGMFAVTQALAEVRPENPRLVLNWLDYAGMQVGWAFTMSLREAQTILLLLGLHRGPVDGFPGAATSQALKEFQAHVGIPVTGEFDLRANALLRNSVFKMSYRPIYQWGARY